jgi:hypothetical protein
MKMGGLVGRRDLQTIIKMGMGAIKEYRRFVGRSVQKNLMLACIRGRNIFCCDLSKEVFDGNSGLR